MKAVFVVLNARFAHSSLALRYLKAVNGEFDIKLCEFTINDGVFDIYSRLLAEKADYYCFSCYIWNIENTVKIAKLLKTAFVCKVVLGGPEVSYNPESYDFADHIICGEGEYAIGEILSGKASEKIIYGRNFDLNEMPFPYTDRDFEELKNRIIYFETSRGCPCKCTYCLSGDDVSVRYFPMEYVKHGFDVFFKNRVPLVKLIDRTFNADKKRAEEIISYIINNSECTCVHLEIEPHFLDEGIINLLCSAPKDMFQLEIGVQSTNEAALKAVRRSSDTDKMSENIRRLRNADNMHIHLDLIAGLPYEDYESFKSSFDFVYKLKPHMLQLGFLKVLHGSAMGEEKGIRFAPFPPYRVLSTDWISADELYLLDITEKAVDLYYNSGAFEKTLGILEERPFDIFLRLGNVLAKKGRVTRGELYNIMYNEFGEKVYIPLLHDFLNNNRDMPLPSFAKRTHGQGFKKKIRGYIGERDIKNLRFESVSDRIYMTDYEKKKTYDITGEV